MRDATESDLVAASRCGDHAAFGELVRRFASMIDAVAYAATRDRTLADEVAQETFVAGWHGLDRLRNANAIRPWLCKIARNLAHKARRREARGLVLDAETVTTEVTPFDALCARDAERLVGEALAKIPTLYRETLVLFYFEQQSSAAVASALGIAEDVVHQRLSRGRRHLAAVIEQHLNTELKRRRSRRDLVAGVLAALALVPRPVHATPRGVSMQKIGFVTAATATVALTLLATRPSADAAPRPAAAPAKAQAKAPATPRLATNVATPSSSACRDVARHIMRVSLAALEDAATEHAAQVQRVTEELETRCRQQKWTPRELSCLNASQYPGQLAKCRPAEVQPVEGPPVPVGADVDVSCANVGAHVGDLMIEELSLDDLSSVAAVALTDKDELVPGSITSCTDDEWSEPLRRCYAAADRFPQVVACNLRWR